MSKTKNIHRLGDNRVGSNIWLVFCIFLVSAATLRILFSAGISNETELVHIDRAAGYVNYLKEVRPAPSEALAQARSQMGGLSDLIMYAPNLLTFLLFGISRWTSVVPSFLFSLANVYLVYAIARFLTKSQAAALIASLLWIFTPLDIFYTTTSPRIEVLGFISLLTIWFFLLGKNGKQFYVASFFGGLLIFFLDTGALIAPTLFISYHFLANQQNRRPFLSILAIGIGVLLLLEWKDLGKVFLEFYSLILNQPENVVMLPLFLVAATVLLIEKPSRRYNELALALSAIIAFIVSKLFLGSPQKEADIYNTGVFALPLFISFAIVIGDYFANNTSEKQGIKWATNSALIGSLAATAAIIGDNDFLPSFANFYWIGLHSLFLIFSIFAGVAFAGALVSPYFVTGQAARWKDVGRYSLLMLILLAMLPFSETRSSEQRNLVEAPTQALAFIGGQDLSLPIHTVTDQTYMLLSAFSKFDALTLKETRLISTSIDRVSMLEEGYIFAFEDELGSIPETWFHLGSFGQLGEPRIAVYRSLPAAEALKLSQSSENPGDTYGFLINMGLFCEAYSIWAESIDPSEFQVVPYNSSSKCLEQGASLVDLEDLREPSSIQGYITFPRPPETNEDASQLDMRQVSLPIYDERTSLVEITLEPNSLYLYSIEVQSPSPTITLYWNVDGHENYLEMKTYAEWSTVAVLMQTPDWDAAMPALFSPVLFDHLDTVSLRDFFIGRVEIIDGPR